MKLKSTLAYVLGSAATGGALYYGISRLIGSKSKTPRTREKMLVRVTENGRKYHRDNCPLLHGETRVISVTEAIEHYEPCKACHPPGDLGGAIDETMDPKLAASRLTSDANGTTARTDASAQLERGTAGAAAGSRIGNATASTGIQNDPVGEPTQSGVER